MDAVPGLVARAIALRDLFALHPDNTFVIKAAYLCWQERGTGDDRHEVVACMEGASEGKVHLPPAPRPDT